MKIFASDYDGTLSMGNGVSVENKVAIRKWREQGNLFVIVSGRSMESMQKEAIEQALEVDYFIGNNGGVVYDAKFQEIKSYYFPFAKALDMISYIKSERTISYVINDGFYRAKMVLDPSREDKKYANTKTTYQVADLLAKQKIAQIVVSLDNDEDTSRIANYINATFHDVACAYRNINCVDIAPYGISKATGIACLMNALHMNVKDIYAIGDSYNDIAMLSTYYGFAMAQASAQVKSYAKQITSSVADAIYQIMMEKEPLS